MHCFHLNERKLKPNLYVDLSIMSNHSNEEAWSSVKVEKIKFDIKIQDFTNSPKYLLI